LGFSEWFSGFNQSNEITEIVISFIDITERKLMEMNCEIKEQSEAAKIKPKRIFWLI
jgi:hypothetical protein